jgi:hypothetical protein
VTKVVKQASMLLVAAMTILAGSAGIARADEFVSAKVPFAFEVGGTKMPAGVYTISYKVQQPNAITITAASGEHVTIALGVKLSSENLANGPRLEFRRASDTYYLERVVLSDDNGIEMSLPATTPPRSH